MIKIDHRGYEIYFSENSDRWVCGNLKLEDVSLAKLREKINKLDLAVRKELAFPVLVIRHDGSSVEGTALEARKAGSHQRAARGDVEVAVLAAAAGGKPGRSFRPLSDLALPTVEVYAALDVVKAAQEDQRAAAARLKAAVEAVPRLTELDVGALLKHSEKEED